LFVANIEHGALCSIGVREKMSSAETSATKILNNHNRTHFSEANLFSQYRGSTGSCSIPALDEDGKSYRVSMLFFLFIPNN
jgi:hypothetical protein